MTRLTNWLTSGFKSQIARRNVPANRFRGFHVGLARERLAAGQRFVTHHRERENIRRRRTRLHLDLLRRHVLERTFEPGHGIGAHQMNNPEIDDLYRVVIHDENVAGLQIAVNYTLFVRRLQSPACLRRRSRQYVPESVACWSFASAVPASRRAGTA